ncbi:MULTISPECIES: large conductance mechanosensitive channel protein MscL [Deinococcus]|uniref:Large-conductance mechanosensitive channel n=1 Tax=Deinococcus rufus TaxID=2136097 RepID=A0ABV7Z615_9DEIO|nr:large conductance mechanosensitive channel protein MscL [Deinococcus sp. AB2017081]WQE96407.1 large conductance mechanosensitive channel protein MscL [Deinococcus sp. AB2017081]
MVEGFKKFLLRGNLIDLAVGVLIGAAFGKVVDSFTSGLILPIIGIFGGVPDFSALSFTVNGSIFKYGAFLTNLLSFVLTAAVIYFFVITPFNRLMERFKREEKPAVAEPSNEEKLLAEIRDALRARP